MGRTAELFVGHFYITETKHKIIPELLSLFQSSDLQINHQNKEKEDNFDSAKLIISSEKLLDRLKILGFSKHKTIIAFDEGIEALILENESFLKYLKESDSELDVNEYYYKIQLLKKIKYRDYIDSLLDAYNKYRYLFSFDFRKEEYKKLNNTSKDIFDCLYDGHEEYDLFFPNPDFRWALRTLLDNLDCTKDVVLDISEFIDFNTPNEELEEIFLQEKISVSNDLSNTSKILIITEGSSDITILKKTLDLLYPHLVDFYYFFDFNYLNTSKSAASLVHTIKAFASSEISNKVIALFDNDKAAIDALRNLDRTKISQNISILNYPELDFAKNYPILMPDKSIEYKDINALACSIELYLGEDIIKSASKVYFPIVEKGGGQGVITNKRKIQKAYNKKVNSCIVNKSLIDSYDWAPMRKIFTSIFNAFD